MKTKFLKLCATPITYGAYFKFCGIALAIWAPIYAWAMYRIYHFDEL